MTRAIPLAFALLLSASIAAAQTPPATPVPAAPAAPAPGQPVAKQLGVTPYPSKGQTPEQQAKDEQECFAWAKQNTGLDPFAPVEPVQAAAPAKGGAVRGAAKGAAAGAAVGGVASGTSAGEGAAVGATAGAIKGVAGKKKQQAAAEQQAQAATQQKAADIKANFNKAFTACLDGKGYSVK
ncbi:MAG TPA: hypothetical protein VFP65_25015 [Anaeromyxobacteraceae bacterium]|nr:hypothetical protein [Anaeromyxobacteraceae bacterium]